MMQKEWLLFGSMFFLLACNREDAPDCFQAGGEERNVYRLLPNFNAIELRDYIQFEFAQSEEYAVEIRGPGNLLNDIVTDVRDGKLFISNQNTCNFVRSFKRKIYVKIYAPRFGEIDHYGSGDVSSADTLYQSRFLMNFRHATGHADLKLHCDTVSIFMHTGSADCVASGFANTTELFANGLGFLDASDLHSTNVFIRQSSIQTLKARGTAYMYCRIQSRGDVVMYEQPIDSDVENFGSGELIFMN